MEATKRVVYFTRDSFCMADDVMAPNIRRFEWRDSDWAPEASFYHMLDEYIYSGLPGYYWRGYAGKKWIADVYLDREDDGFKKECKVAKNWRELLQKYGSVYFIHTEYENRDSLPKTLKDDGYTFKQAEKIYKEYYG